MEELVDQTCILVNVIKITHLLNNSPLLIIKEISCAYES